jgi:hypothetical protein
MNAVVRANVQRGRGVASTAPACCSNIPMAEYRQISCNISDRQLRGLISIAGPHSLAGRAAAPRQPTFSRRHPGSVGQFALAANIPGNTAINGFVKYERAHSRASASGLLASEHSALD